MDAHAQLDYPLAAYTERDSIDPQTCEEGKLRREWAVISIHEAQRAIFAPRNRELPRDWDEYVLIARYVRRGKVEPWAVMDFYPSEDAALRDILDTGVVAVDIRLMTIQREREWALRAEQAKRAAESEKAREREAKRTRRIAGSKAFKKLYEKGEGTPDRALCERWNDFTSSPANVARRDLYAADPAFMERYYLALYADRLPTKRKAMREFFAYVEEHYPGNLTNTTTTEKRRPHMSSIGVYSYPNQERSEAKKGTCVGTVIHPNKLTAITYAEEKRKQGYSCRVYERPVKADNRVMLVAVTVIRERRQGRAK